MAAEKSAAKSSIIVPKFIQYYGWDLLLGFIAAFYAIMAPYTKVEESFNVQAMHDILYNHHHIEKYDHLEFPGVVPRTFLGSLLISLLASPAVLLVHFLHLPKLYTFSVVRLLLGAIVLTTLRFFRVQVKRKFGNHVEAFFVILTAVQFHLLYYSTRPLPNVFALSLVNLAYSFWFKGNPYATLKCLTFATIVFRCDVLLLFGPIGLELLFSKSITIWEAVKCCITAAIVCIGLTILLDSIMWQRILWPEFEVFWFNSVLNKSSEWGTQPFHWYFTSALPRSLLVAYPLCLVGGLLDRRILRYILPVTAFVVLYSKLPHKELRFIIYCVPMLNVSAAITASRVFNNWKKIGWKWLNLAIFGCILISLGCSIVTFMASYDNYPGGHALKNLHRAVTNACGGSSTCTKEMWVHIDAFTAMNGVSRFSEHEYPWRYSKEEGIALAEYANKNFTYLLNEHSSIDGYSCLFIEKGFSRIRLQVAFPPIVFLKEPKVYIHGNIRDEFVATLNWPGCSL